MALVPKEGGSMSYQVSVLTSTNYPAWAVKVKSTMNAYGLWGTSFLQIVASIEQYFELDSMLFDEAVGKLKGYKERLKGTDKMEDIGLLLASQEKSHSCKHCGDGCSNQDDFGRGRGGGRGSGKIQDGNERVRDKSHIKCYK
ncbi:hypothetical protein Tco_1011660 [Tanacetum coccineum]